jgi:hypothetical protein
MERFGSSRGKDMLEGSYRISWHAARVALTGLLAASTLVFAQDTVTPPAAPPSQDTTNNGWKRVDPQGNVQTYSAQVNQDGSNAQQQGDPNAPPPPQYPPQSQYPPQGQYPQTANPNGSPQYPPPQYPPQYPQSGYPPQSQQPGYANAPQSAPPPVPPNLMIQPGTYITVKVNQALSSKRNHTGDAFTATLAAPVVVNGVVVAEPGQTIGGHVALAEPSHGGSTGRLGLQLTNLTLVDGQQVPLATQLIGRKGATTPTGQEVGTVAATTGVGAAIGAAAGWGTGAAIGAGAGAVAGLIGVVLTHGHDSVVYPEETLTFRIDQPVTISTTISPQAFHYVEPGEYNQPNYGPGPYGPGYATAPPPAYYAAGYPYPYYGYGYGYYPYYWGPSFGFYFGPGYWWGGRYYYGRGYWGGRYAGGGVVVHGAARR